MEGTIRKRDTPNPPTSQQTPPPVDTGPAPSPRPPRPPRGSGQWVNYAILGAFTCLFLMNMALPPLFDIHELPPLTPPMSWTGPLEENRKLEKAELILKKAVSGPESLVIDSGVMYTGLSDGWVVAVHLDTLEVRRLVRFGGGPCTQTEEEVTCGRPLGMRMWQHGGDGRRDLVVADAYMGLYRVNTATGEYVTLLNSSLSSHSHGTKRFMLINDVEFSEKDDDVIYFTDSSSEFRRYDFMNVLLSGSRTGRVIEYNQRTQTGKVLVDNLLFPNGLQKTQDGGLLVADTFNARILKYNFDTKTYSVWVDGLPGLPDNIRYVPESKSYLVGLVALRHPERFSIIDFIVPRAWLRRSMANLLNIYVIEWWKEVLDNTGLIKARVMVLELSESGRVLQSFQDPDGKSGVSAATEVSFHGDGGSGVSGDLYLGSYKHEHVARLRGVTLLGPGE